MKHHDDLVRDRDSKFFSELFVAHVFWSRDLHFEIMVAAAKGTDLVVTPINCAFADLRSIGARDATVLLGNFKVVLPAVIALNTPARALLDQVAKILMRQFEKPVTSHSRRNTLIEPVNDLM